MRQWPFHRQLLLTALCCSCAVLSMQASAAAQSLWASTAKSSGNYPIEVARFGKGNQFVLIVGSLLGNEPESLELMDAACKLASTVPPPEPVTLLFVRTMNPDGVHELVHTNSRGVELNRNFPSPHFTLIPNRLTGPAPASEVETQYMLRVLQEYKPSRVIHVRSGHGDRPLVLVNDLWVANGQAPVLPKHVNHGYFEQAFKVGSLEEYVARQMKTPVSTVTLAANGAQQLKAAELLRFATSNVAGTSAAPAGIAEQTAPPKEMTSSPASAPEEAVAKALEVEFLPPPPEYASTQRPDQGAAAGDTRYFELPPPPR
ncbi:M14 family zinc carboxypeptidase [Planctomicrobium sp. SH661]|uniref:M14 family zinc carboxypeptidase n=1 Tax=Planctomicrobium sp. SH661 TaxID=3448124 RepID=UPI003F5C760C